MAVRVGNFKQVFAEQRAGERCKSGQSRSRSFVFPNCSTWARSFRNRDSDSNTYWDWLLDHAFLGVPTQAVVGEFLATFKEFPPWQKPASFTIDQVMEKLQQAPAK